MKTVDEISKLKAVILYILKSFPEGIEPMKLFKIMYFVQQDHLVTYGLPVFNDTFHAFGYGPVPSFSNKCFKMLKGDLYYISEDAKTIVDSLGFDHVKQLISIKEEPEMEELSKSNVKSITRIIEKYGLFSPLKLSELSHDQAWRNASDRANIDPEMNRMSLIEIAEAGSADLATIEYIKESQIIRKAFSD